MWYFSAEFLFVAAIVLYFFQFSSLQKHLCQEYIKYYCASAKFASIWKISYCPGWRKLGCCSVSSICFFSEPLPVYVERWKLGTNHPFKMNAFPDLWQLQMIDQRDACIMYYVEEEKRHIAYLTATLKNVFEWIGIKYNLC